MKKEMIRTLQLRCTKYLKALCKYLTLKYVRVLCSQYIKVVNQKSNTGMIEFEKRCDDDIKIGYFIFVETFDT